MRSILPAMREAYLDPRLHPARPDLAAASLRDRYRAARYVEGRLFTVVRGTAALRGARDSAGPALTELLFGEPFTVYEERSGWVWGQSECDGYVGYVERAALAPGSRSPTHRVAALFAHLYETPALKTAAKALLPLGAGVSVGALSECGNYALLLETEDWISARQIRPIDALESDYVATAERFFGAPYLWGGRTAAGLDCSGLVQIAMGLAGYRMPRDSDLQLAACRGGLAEPVERGAARRGDIAFFPTHVGLMLDNETLLHANVTHMAVTADPLETVIGWLAKDHDPPFDGLYRPKKRSDDMD